MHGKAQSKVLSKIASAGVLFGLVSAGFIAAPTGPAHASVSPPITSCTITDGVTSQSVWPLNTPLDAIYIPSARVRMVPTPATGAFVSAPIGFAKLDGSQWVQISGGTGLANNPGYQPPGADPSDLRDPGSWALSNFTSYPEYPRSEWGFEFRFYAATTDVNGYDPASQPLCVIRVVATDPVISGQSAVTIPGGTTAVGTYAASRSVTWTVLEYGPADIQISPSGVLSFVTAPAPGTYEAWVNATDASGSVFERKVDITVLAAQAPGTTGTPTAVAGNGSATVTIVAPSSGGTPVSYLVTASNGATCTVSVPATSCTVTGLTNGTAYTFTSTATNATGTSLASASSNSVTPSAPPPQNSSTSSGSSPQKQHTNTLNTTPAPGETVSMFGSFFDRVTEVFVGGVKVEIVSKSDNRVNIRMPRVLTGALDVELKSPLGSLLLPKHFTMGKLPAAGGQQTTLIVGGFDPNSRKLTARMQARIDRWLDRNSDLSTLTCTGFTSLPRRTTDVQLSTNRGATACNFAKNQRPDLTTAVSQGVEDPRPGSNVRRVKLVLTP